MTERNEYVLRSEERALRWVAFFKDKGLNPTLTAPEDPKYEHAQWRVEYDGAPLLPKDGHQPGKADRHWQRPEYHSKYGYWFAAQKPDFTRCCVELHGIGMGASRYQCTRKAVADPDYTGAPTRCKAHSREALSAKRAAADAKDEARREAWRKEDQRRKSQEEAIPLLRKIAEGHNDPRGAAIEFLTTYGLWPGEKP